ncbi:hypothetical protein F4818DRAFT_407621 [Hypoxylon cercidicola]|nr:hypothetical protein F4818DRAFT_407621 [Hypoxylon cercidicola]
MSNSSRSDPPTNTDTPSTYRPTPLAKRVIPRGTVSSRIRRLHRLTHFRHGLPEDPEFTAREQQYVLVG